MGVNFLRFSGGVVAVGLLGLIAAPTARAGATAAGGGGHDAFNFSAEAYRAVEGENDAVVVERGQHGTGPATVDLTASLGDETSAADFTPFSRVLSFQDPVESQEVFLQSSEDSDQEGLETVNLKLSNPSSGAVVAYPDDAVLTIVDDDGPSRISLEFGSYSTFENRSSLLVRIIRSGSTGAPASVTVKTAPGSAIAENDYTHTDKKIEFCETCRYGTVTIPLLNDTTVEGSETFSVQLSAQTGAELMPPSTATITLLDDDSASAPDNTAPYTAFHQPLHGETYAARNMQDFIVFMQDNDGGSGMDRVQLAIRKNLSSGRCKWWTGSDFVRRACDDKKWSKTPSTEYSETTIFSLGTKLNPSTRGSGIKNYTAFSRGWDNVGNVQKVFDKGQNKNTFEIK